MSLGFKRLNRRRFTGLDPSSFLVWIFVERYLHKLHFFTRRKNAHAHGFVRNTQQVPTKFRVNILEKKRE